MHIQLKERILKVSMMILDESRLLVHGIKPSDVKTWRNEINDPVTCLDILLQRRISRELANYFPNAAIVAEEAGDIPSLSHGQLLLIVDPLDGTHVFLAGHDDWGISIAAVANGIPLVGVLDFPQLDRRIWAIKDGGCHLNSEKVELQALGSSSPCRIAVSPRQLDISRLRTGLKVLNARPLPVSAVTPKVAAVIEGKVEAAVFLKQEQKQAAIWDYAAAVLIVHEAGGIMSSLSGEPLPYNISDLFHEDGWVASSQGLYDKVVSAFHESSHPQATPPGPPALN